MGVDAVTQHQNGQAAINVSTACANYHKTFEIVIALVGFPLLTSFLSFHKLIRW